MAWNTGSWRMISGEWLPATCECYVEIIQHVNWYLTTSYQQGIR